VKTSTVIYSQNIYICYYMVVSVFIKQINHEIGTG